MVWEVQHFHGLENSLHTVPGKKEKYQSRLTRNIIRSSNIKHDNIYILIGKLYHIIFVITNIWHFLDYPQALWLQPRKCTLSHISPQEEQKIILWINFNTYFILGNIKQQHGVPDKTSDNMFGNYQKHIFWLQHQVTVMLVPCTWYIYTNNNITKLWGVLAHTISVEIIIGDIDT